MNENRAATITKKVMDLLENMDDSESPEEQASFMTDACLALAACRSTLFAVLPTAHRNRISESAKILEWLEQSTERSPDHA